jgi:hypothetical protein
MDRDELRTKEADPVAEGADRKRMGGSIFSALNEFASNQ